jgi:hypothetical protein
MEICCNTSVNSDLVISEGLFQWLYEEFWITKGTQLVEINYKTGSTDPNFELYWHMVW